MTHSMRGSSGQGPAPWTEPERRALEVILQLAEVPRQEPLGSLRSDQRRYLERDPGGTAWVIEDLDACDLETRERAALLKWRDQIKADQALLPKHLRLRWPIKEGGQGIVYVAEEVLIAPASGEEAPVKRLVALKVPRNQERGLDRSRLRFQREVECLGQFDHRRIVTLYGTGELATTRGPSGYFTMEIVDREQKLTGCEPTTFADAIRSSGDGPEDHDPKRLLLVVQRACDAVARVHEVGRVHCDIKPDNLLLTTGDDPRLIDFGSVARCGESVQVWRTLGYYHPDVLDELPHSGWDLYGLAVMVCEAYHGRLLLGAEPADVRALARKLPATLRRACLPLLEDPRGAVDAGASAMGLRARIRKYLRQERALGDLKAPLLVFAVVILATHLLATFLLVEAEGEGSEFIDWRHHLGLVLCLSFAYLPMFWLTSRLANDDETSIRKGFRAGIARWWDGAIRGRIGERFEPRRFACGLWLGHALAGMSAIAVSFAFMNWSISTEAFLTAFRNAYGAHFVVTGLAIWATGCVLVERLKVLALLWWIAAPFVVFNPGFEGLVPAVFGCAASASALLLLVSLHGFRRPFLTRKARSVRAR